MNRITLIGRLTKQLELRTSGSGNSITAGTIAVNRQFKNAEGNYDADFINFKAFKSTAEYLCKYTSKGNQIAIEGRLQTGSYENDKKEKIYYTEVIVDNAEILEKKEKTEVKEETKKVDNDPFSDFADIVNGDNYLD